MAASIAKVDIWFVLRTGPLHKVSSYVVGKILIDNIIHLQKAQN